MRRMRQAMLPLMSAVLAVGLMSGCSGSDENPDSSPSPTVERADDAKLGQALDRIVFYGKDMSPDKGKCFVGALRDVGASPAAEAELVKLNTDNWATAVQSVRKRVSIDDADLLLGTEFRSAIDDCVSTQLEIDPSVKPEKAKNPEAVDNSGDKKPVTKPAHKINVDEEIRNSEDLEPGVKSMFLSFAGDEKAEKMIKGAAPCMSSVIFDANFSQETLHFIAGGAPLGSGSIADQLKNEEDQKIWSSPNFVSQLSACTDTQARKADEEREDS